MRAVAGLAFDLGMFVVPAEPQSAAADRAPRLGSAGPAGAAAMGGVVQVGAGGVADAFVGEVAGPAPSSVLPVPVAATDADPQGCHQSVPCSIVMDVIGMGVIAMVR